MDFERRRIEEFESAIQCEYQAGVFDIDGTLSDKDVESFSEDILDELSSLSMRVPLAVCTGRAKDAALERLNHLFEHCPDAVKCRKNWFLLCENGSVGYVCKDGDNFEEFYRVPFPYSNEEREQIFGAIKLALGERLGLGFQNLESLIFRPARVEGIPLEKCSREVHLIAVEVLKDLDRLNLLACVDAGMGVAVIAKDGNKDRGVREMAGYLRGEQGINFSENAREIMVVGDQGGPGGNDESLLSGDLGTPFTVGELHPHRLYPLPVISQGKVIKGPRATVNLLRQLQFNDMV